MDCNEVNHCALSSTMRDPSLTAYTTYFKAYTLYVYPLKTIYLYPFSTHVVEEHVR